MNIRLSLESCPKNERKFGTGAHSYLENSTVCHKSMPINLVLEGLRK